MRVRGLKTVVNNPLATPPLDQELALDPPERPAIELVGLNGLLVSEVV